MNFISESFVYPAGYCPEELRQQLQVQAEEFRAILGDDAPVEDEYRYEQYCQQFTEMMPEVGATRLFDGRVWSVVRVTSYSPVSADSRITKVYSVVYSQNGDTYRDSFGDKGEYYKYFHVPLSVTEQAVNTDLFLSSTMPMHQRDFPQVGAVLQDEDQELEVQQADWYEADSVLLAPSEYHLIGLCWCTPLLSPVPELAIAH